MIMDYKQVKADVLKQYDAVMPIIKEIKDNSATTFDTLLNQLQMDVDNIKNDIFRLMIVGEAKSGKSTFINAYLGKEILPMDVKQCTSAIVEIRYGQKFVLKATYADDRVKVISEEEEIEKFLKENAALDDEYRDIPVGTINLQLIIPNKGKRISQSEINELLRMIADDNLYKLPQQVYNQKVLNYIEAKNSHWQELVKKIEIEYPFEDEDLKGIQIVDTPGVGAEGRVGEITDKYIKNANAVMFLKPLVGATLETNSFKNFLKKVGKDRTSDAMFLILTRAANETPNNVARIHEEAYKQFPNINKKQIIHLDSKVEMFRNKAKAMTEEELQAFMDKKIEEAEWYNDQIKNLSEEEKRVFMDEHKDMDILDSFLETPWYRSRCQREGYLQKLADLSNFKEIDVALNQFARKAQYMLLRDALSRMLGILNKIQSELSENVKHYKEKAQNPAELECKLLNAEAVLKNLQFKINHTVDEIAAEYTGTDGIITTKSSKIIEEYKEEMGKIDPNSSTGISELEQLTFRKVASFREFEADITKNIVAECDEALIAFSKKGDLNYTSLKPDITPEVLEKVKSERRTEAEDTYTTGICFKETHTKLNQSKFFNLVNNDIQKRLNKIKNDVIIALNDYVLEVTCAYRTELVHNAQIQENNYRKIREDKANAEEMQKKIEAMESKLNKIQPMISEIGALKGGIDKNV
ncbi:dynamin family protein [Dysosmobacter sp.]|uniref:dynamin family protein n=1 Tax=Dysosmobacter sp. TaxID=2591382 RepID=UPI002A8347CA|nr:dynamin family protein [Dysosmobacter sp.]MDY3652873.1 dynamin family protein [Dysosmobacter sp.]